MRFLLIVLSLVFLIHSEVFAQADIAKQRFEQGLTNAAAARYERALKDFQNALEKYKFASEQSDEFAAKINYNVGVCLYRLGRIDEAVPFLETAIKLAKNKYPKAFRALGIVEGELGNPAAAKQAFASAVRLDRRDGESWFDLAMIHLQEKDFRRAADGFQNAIRYGSVDRATASNNLGVIAAMNDDWLAAEKQFETALAMSGGKLPEAKRNLELCRSLNNAPDLIAKLEFILKKN